MSLPYVLRPKADRDLDEIADYYVSESGLELGERFLVAAHETFVLLAKQPQIGWRCRLKHPSLETARMFRVHGFEKILVFYAPAPGRIEILRIVHGSQDLEAAFGEE